MMLASLFLRTLLLYLVALGNAEEECDSNLSYNLMKNDKIVDIDETCKTVPCLTKCCAESQILFDNGTERSYCQKTSYLEMTYNVSNLEDYSELAIYNEVIERKIKSTKMGIQNFTIVHYENFIKCSPEQDFFSIVFSPFVLENGTMEVFAAYNLTKRLKSHKMGEFCFENIFTENTREMKFFKKVIFGKSEKEKRGVINANCMMVSCVFTVLVLVVYSLLKHLRNLPGIVLMAYVATYTAFCVIRIVHVYTHYYEELDNLGCTVMTLLVYFTLISSFSWLNVMSFDIWWTFRAIRNDLETNRRGILVKFAWYGLYGWGAPLLATAFVVLADSVTLPGIMRPEVLAGSGGGCFFGDKSHKYYVNYAIALMVSVNFVWFGLTAYNVWHVRRAINQYDKDKRTTNRKNENRFLVYVKLSVMMGISRIFDGIDLDYWVFYVIDGLNSCSGLFIFILFVCKKKIYRQLCERLSKDSQLAQNRGRRSTRTTLLSNTQSVKSTDTKSEQPKAQ